MVKYLWLVAALAACEARPDLGSDYKLALAADDSLLRPLPTLLRLHVHTDTDNHVELCVKNGAIDLRVATLTLEKDVTDAYHLRVAALDSALNDDVFQQITRADLPTSLVRGLTPFELAIAAVVRDAEYVLKFCRTEQSTKELHCESQLGLELNGWKPLTTNEPCEPPPVCSGLPAATPGLGCLTDGGRSLCEAIRTLDAPGIIGCITRDVVAGTTIDEPTLRTGCEELGEGLRATETLTDSALCDKVGTLCDQVKSIANVKTVCHVAGQVFDTIARCCSSLAQPPTDAGIDAPADAAPADGGNLPDGLLPDVL